MGGLTDEELHARIGPNPYYAMWTGMVARCYKESHTSYQHYGGRGIEVYERWRTNPGYTKARGGFDRFVDYIIENLGPRPEGMSLDRIDNDGNYEPGNLRWATRKEQRQNQRPSR